MGDSATFGDFLRSTRRKAGFKQQVHLAKATGISQATISRLERDIYSPSAETLGVLSEPLGISTDELMKAAGYVDEPAEDEASELVKLRVENAALRKEQEQLKTAIKNLTKGW